MAKEQLLDSGMAKEVPYVVLQADERLGMAVAGIAAEHRDNVLNAMAVAGKLVVTLSAVDSLAINLTLPLTDKDITDFLQYRDNDIVEQMMTLYI